jgi:hypothetical protein
MNIKDYIDNLVNLNTSKLDNIDEPTNEQLDEIENESKTIDLQNEFIIIN